MCDRASYVKMTSGTNLMQQLWFIIINNSTCFGHLYAHLQEYRLCAAACGVVAVVLRRRCVVLCTVCQFVLLLVVFSTRCYGCGPEEPVCSLVHCVSVLLLHLVFSTRCYGCGPKEPVVVLCTVCEFVSGHKLTHSAQDYTPAPQDHSHNTQC